VQERSGGEAVSRTRHHNKPSRERLTRLPDRYTGWLGEDIRKAKTKAWRKRLEHHAARRFKGTDDE
jgi:hypothetical protein